MVIYLMHLSTRALCQHTQCLLFDIGTASAAMWTLRAEGHLFHSGLPHKGINSLELGMEAVAYLQKRFYQDFLPVCFSKREGGERKNNRRGKEGGRVGVGEESRERERERQRQRGEMRK